MAAAAGTVTANTPVVPTMVNTLAVTMPAAVAMTFNTPAAATTTTVNMVEAATERALLPPLLLLQCHPRVPLLPLQVLADVRSRNNFEHPSISFAGCFFVCPNSLFCIVARY